MGWKGLTTAWLPASPSPQSVPPGALPPPPVQGQLHTGRPLCFWRLAAAVPKRNRWPSGSAASALPPFHSHLPWLSFSKPREPSRPYCVLLAFVLPYPLCRWGS